jgi:hypothetical protein
MPIILVLYRCGAYVAEGEVLVVRVSSCDSLAVCSCYRDSHVSIATSEVEVFAVQFELRSGSRHETFGRFAGECCCSAYKQSEGSEADQHSVAR